MKIASWNIGGGRPIKSDVQWDYNRVYLEYFATELKKYDPDIVCIKEMQLKTSTLQKMAQAFYEKNDYVKMGVEKSYYEEGPFEAVWYKKELK